MDDLEILEREYQIRIEATQEAEVKARLEQERDRRVAQYWQSQAKTQALETTKAGLLTKYPEADPSAITGATPEELEASAKASHDRISERLAAREQAAKEAAQKELAAGRRQNAYGGGAPTGGGTPAAPEGVNPPGEFREEWQGRLDKMVNNQLDRTEAEWLQRKPVAKVFESFIGEGLKTPPEGTE